MHLNNNNFVDAVIGFLFGAGGVSVLNWLLRRRETEADIIAKQQDVIDSLWGRVDALQKRVQELEEQVARIAEEAKQLRRLLDAYEKRFGRRFRIGPGGKVVEVDEQGG
jgi:cell division protein FtsB